jgi:hypothetical protein
MAFVVVCGHIGWDFWRDEVEVEEDGTLTAATLPEAETAVTARLDCRRAVLNIVKKD